MPHPIQCDSQLLLNWSLSIVQVVEKDGMIFNKLQDGGEDKWGDMKHVNKLMMVIWIL